MSVSAEVITLENHGDWTIVLPRQGKRRTNLRRSKSSRKHHLPRQWVPLDLKLDIERESKLMQKMLLCISELEISQFYQHILYQMLSSKMLDSFDRVLGSESSMQMVIYGIGSIESSQTSRLQLSLALLMKRKFGWIKNIELFDPVLSATESRVLEFLGCSMLFVNEEARRHASGPILFYMPHCEVELYNNLLQANWQQQLLSRIVLFGNSLGAYQRYMEVVDLAAACHDFPSYVLAVLDLADEFKIKTVSDEFSNAFHDLSWHFFHSDRQEQRHSAGC